MPVIGFAIKKPSTPPEPEWVSYFDNTRWGAASSTSWTGTAWSSSGFEIYLDVAVSDDWYEGYRPTKIRVTYTGGPVAMSLVDENLNDIAEDASYVSGTELDITFDQVLDGDISKLRDMCCGSMEVTNIEFLV